MWTQVRWDFETCVDLSQHPWLVRIWTQVTGKEREGGCWEFYVSCGSFNDVLKSEFCFFAYVSATSIGASFRRRHNEDLSPSNAEFPPTLSIHGSEDIFNEHIIDFQKIEMEMSDLLHEMDILLHNQNHIDIEVLETPV